MRNEQCAVSSSTWALSGNMWAMLLNLVRMQAYCTYSKFGIHKKDHFTHKLLIFWLNDNDGAYKYEYIQNLSRSIVDFCYKETY